MFMCLPQAKFIQHIKNPSFEICMSSGNEHAYQDTGSCVTEYPVYCDVKISFSFLLPFFSDSLCDEELVNLSDLIIPSIDIEDLPLPYLDDSLDIEPNMGTLEIWETSTPASFSPRVAKDVTSSLDHSGINDDSLQ
jgi:hypothetical protein